MSARADTIGIVGAGTFGTALASVLARAGKPVILWSRDTEIVNSIRTARVCPRLPRAPLPAPLEATADPKELAQKARFLVLAVSSTNVRDRARELGEVLDGSHIVVHAVGALAAPTNERVSEVVAAGVSTLKLGVLAGPALPQDLVGNQFSSMVVASAFDEVVAEGRRLLNAPPMLRVYSSKDLAGVELASALAGAYTVALGLADGLAIGHGARTVLITRAVAEGGRLLQSFGADPRTFAGLAGLGNLLIRGVPNSNSADYALGKRLAEGVVTAESSRSEGARAAIALSALATKAHMPVLKGVAGILAGKIEPRDAAKLIGDTVAVEE